MAPPGISLPAVQGRRWPRVGAAVSGSSRPVRRSLTAAAWLLGAVAGFCLYLRLARTLPTNSDGASQALQAWDMLHGNVLLRGWALGDVTFYTTELPEYMLVELIRGLNQDVVHVAAALTYTLAVLLAALLAKGASTGREAVARTLLAVGIMLAPQLGAGTLTLLSSPDHLGTSVPVMLVWVVVDRARPRWYVPVVTSLLLGWSEVADPTVFYIGVLPLVVVCAVRTGRGLAAGERWPARWHDLALGVGALAGAAAAMLALHLIEAHGFHALPASTSLSPLGTILRHNLGMTGDGLLLLTGADFLVWPMGMTALFIMLHIVGLFLGACGIALAAWRFPRERDLVVQVLLVGIGINLAAYLAGIHAAALANTREIAGVLPLGAAVTGRLLGPWLASARRATAALVVVLLGYATGLGFEISQPTVPIEAQPLASWLAAHHLSSGLSGFWASNAVTLATGGHVSIRAVRVSGGRVSPSPALRKAEWYDPADATANFVLLYPGAAGYPGGLPGDASFANRQAVIATFGNPAATYRVGSSTVLVWPRNILADL